MKSELEQIVIQSSGVLVVPNSMPECLRILEITPKPMLDRYLIKEEGIMIQGVIESTLDYVYLSSKDRIEKSKRLTFKINFAQFMEIKNLQEYSTINLRADLEWKEFSLIKPRHIRFFIIVSVNPLWTLKSKD